MSLPEVHFLFFSRGAGTHVRSVLSALSGGDHARGHYLYRFFLPDNEPGNPKRVYTLGRRGRDYARKFLGLPGDWYYNPDRGEKAGFLHLQHSLSLTKALIACQKWTVAQNGYTLVEGRTSYELARVWQLRKAPLAIPDAWLLFEREGRRFPVLLEIDLRTENVNKFKEAIAARIQFIESGMYTQVFGHQAVAVCYVVIGKRERREQLLKWTIEKLKDMGRDNWIGISKCGSEEAADIYSLQAFPRLLFDEG
jgi:hypothetical protein